MLGLLDRSRPREPRLDAWRFHCGRSHLDKRRARDGRVFRTTEQLALAGFLAGYSGLTRDAYTLDLRQYVAWCTEHPVAVFGARRADIECFARHLESLGRARATIARRLCTVACFYRYAEEEGLIAARQRCTCVDLAWTTSPTPPASTATKSARCSSPQDWPAPEIMRSI